MTYRIAYEGEKWLLIDSNGQIVAVFTDLKAVEDYLDNLEAR